MNESSGESAAFEKVEAGFFAKLTGASRTRCAARYQTLVTP